MGGTEGAVRVKGVASQPNAAGHAGSLGSSAKGDVIDQTRLPCFTLPSYGSPELLGSSPISPCGA